MCFYPNKCPTPMSAAVAKVFNTYQLQSPHQAVGNGQHLGVAALVVAAALLSIELKDHSLVSSPSRPLRKPVSNDEETEKDKA